jgi:hypothetical protein
LWGETGTARGSAGGNDEMGEGKDECEAKRGQPALRPSPQSPPAAAAIPIHVLNFTKFGFAVRASRAGHVPHSLT